MILIIKWKHTFGAISAFFCEELLLCLVMQFEKCHANLHLHFHWSKLRPTHPVAFLNHLIKC